MPEEWGGMGLGHVELAMVQAEAAKSRYGPWVFNCQAPDEGNMHTLLHWATPEQAEKYLKPLCKGVVWSCFAMTEPEVAGSTQPLSKPMHTKTGMNGSSTATSGSSPTHTSKLRHTCMPHRRKPDIPQAANSAFIVDLPTEGWNEVDRSKPCTAEPAQRNHHRRPQSP